MITMTRTGGHIIPGHPSFVPGHPVLNSGHPTPLVPHRDKVDKQVHGNHMQTAESVVCTHNNRSRESIASDLSPAHIWLHSNKRIATNPASKCIAKLPSGSTVQIYISLPITFRNSLSTLAPSLGVCRRRGQLCGLSARPSIAARRPRAGSVQSVEANSAPSEREPGSFAALLLCTTTQPLAYLLR